MARRAGQTISAWAAPPETSPDPKLDADLRADVCVVGAGIAGLSIAYTLVHEGKSVIVLEADQLVRRTDIPEQLQPRVMVRDPSVAGQAAIAEEARWILELANGILWVLVYLKAR